MKLPNIVAFAALIGCVVLLALLLHTRRDLEIANAAVASLKASNDELTARIDDLETKVVDDAALKRLQADQRDAIKLRGEVSTLKKSLTVAQNKIADASAAAAKNAAAKSTPQEVAAEEITTNAYARIMSRKVNANMTLGHGLLFGGWQTEPGKQRFAMAVPSQDPSNPGTVMLATKLFEVSDEARGKLDATMLSRAAGQQATVDPDQLATLLKSLESTPGVSIVSSPRMVVANGQQGTVSVGGTLATPEGPLAYGSVIDFTPTLGSDGTVDLAINAKMTLLNGAAPPQQ